jgi:hypothetical protein
MPCYARHFMKYPRMRGEGKFARLRVPGLGGRDRVQEVQGGDRVRAAPGEQGRVEAGAVRAARLDRRDDWLEDRALGLEQGGRVLARPVEEGELEQQLRADLADVLDRRMQPAARGVAAGVGGGVDGALRAEAGLGALGGDETRLQEAADRALDDRFGDLPDAAEVAFGRGQLRDREAVGRLLAQDREHQPFRQRHLG